MVGHLDQDHTGLGQVEVVEVRREVVADQLRKGTSHFHAGGPAAYEHDSERAGVTAGPRPRPPVRRWSGHGCATARRRGGS